MLVKILVPNDYQKLLQEDSVVTVKWITSYPDGAFKGFYNGELYFLLFPQFIKYHSFLLEEFFERFVDYEITDSQFEFLKLKLL